MLAETLCLPVARLKHLVCFYFLYRGERLLAPTPGARNLLCHKTKEEKDQNMKEKQAKGHSVSLTAKDLLKMTHNQLAERKKQVL